MGSVMRLFLPLFVLCLVGQSAAGQDRLRVVLRSGGTVEYALDDVDCLLLSQDNPSQEADTVARVGGTVAEAVDLGLSVRWAAHNVGARRGYQAGRFLTPTEADEAAQLWADGWRLPTREEWTELLDHTTAQWAIADGVPGRRLTAANGQSLFLPLGGFHLADAALSRGAMGIYWSATPSTDLPASREGMYLDSANLYLLEFSETIGASVRLVKP